jgi:hypothetical protein
MLSPVSATRPEAPEREAATTAGTNRKSRNGSQAADSIPGGGGHGWRDTSAH